MKLGDILSGAKRRKPITRLVKFKVVLRNEGAALTTADASAALAFVDEETHQEVLVDAHAALLQRFPNKTIPDAVRMAEESLHFLAAALRDESDPVEAFASLDELRCALTAPVSMQLAAEYNRFSEDEFPDQSQVSPEAFEKLIEDAKKNSLHDLLMSSGFSLIRRALPFMADRYGAPLTPT